MGKVSSVKEIAEIIKDSADKKVLLATHVSPDGDAIGSLIALGLMLEEYDANIRVLFVSGIPDYLSWLEIPWAHNRTIKALKDWTPDILFTLDCGDEYRAGDELAEYFSESKLPNPNWKDLISINIDHHFGNPLFASYNLVDQKKSATAEIVAEIVIELGISFKGLMGQALYLGLVSDTGNFTYGSTSSSTHRVAAEILEAGLDVAKMTEIMDNNWSIGRMNLWGYMMSKMNTHHGGTIAGVAVTSEMLKKHNNTKEDLEGFASWMRKLDGVQATIFIRQESAKQSKLSLRSMGDINVQSVAADFGGGGHKAASGAVIEEAPEKAYSLVLKRLIEEIGPIDKEDD